MNSVLTIIKRKGEENISQCEGSDARAVWQSINQLSRKWHHAARTDGWVAPARPPWNHQQNGRIIEPCPQADSTTPSPWYITKHSATHHSNRKRNVNARTARWVEPTTIRQLAWWTHLSKCVKTQLMALWMNIMMERIAHRLSTISLMLRERGKRIQVRNQ